MIKITIKKYMIIDLAMLIGLGVIVEAIAMYVLPLTFSNASPFFCVSLFICILAIGRWNFKGAVAIPIMALVSTGFGLLFSYISKNNRISELTDFYTWRVLVTNLLSLCSALVLIPFKRVFGKKAIFKERLTTELIGVSILAICFVVQILVFSVVTLASPIKLMPVLAINMLPAILVTLMFMVILRHQGILVDAKTDLIDKKREEELEDKYYSPYRSNIIDRPNEDDESSK